MNTNKKGRGPGRNNKGTTRVSIAISGQPEEIRKLKGLAAEENKNVSQYVLEKTGVRSMNNWFVADDDGNLMGHDMSESKAKALAKEMQEKEPEANWEALSGDEE